MKNKTSLLACGLSLLLVSPSMATVTLQFISPFSTTGGVNSNFADSLGIPTNGMFWGVIIDTDNSGFSTTYDPFDLNLGLVSVLGVGGASSTNVLVLSNTLTGDTSAFSEFSDTFSPENPGGVGGIGSVTNVAVDGTNGVNSGDIFRLVWFDPSGTAAGFIDDSSFVLPPDTSTTDYSEIFRGPDPIRPANGITVVPEPSTFLLGSVGLCFLLRRKR